MSERPVLDGLLKRAVPRPVLEHRPPPEALAEGLFGLERRLRHFGAAVLPSRSTLVRLDDGALVVVSPPALVDDEAAAGLDALGPVRDVVVPNPFHYLYTDPLLARYPEARLWAAPGVFARVPELASSATEAAELSEAKPPGHWAGQLELAVLGPVRGLSEVLLFHVASGSLLLTDVAFNMVQHVRRFDALFWRMNGIPGRFGPGRTSRQLLLRDRAAAARCLARVLAWPIRRIVPTHGEVIEADAAERLREAFADTLGG